MRETLSILKSVGFATYAAVVIPVLAVVTLYNQSNAWLSVAWIVLLAVNSLIDIVNGYWRGQFEAWQEISEMDRMLFGNSPATQQDFEAMIKDSWAAEEAVPDEHTTTG